MIDLEDFIYKYDGSQRELLTYFHNLLTIDFGLTAKLTYNLPFYYGKSWICYLFPTKKGAVELTFTRGNELSNEQGLLKRKGRKMVSSIGFGCLKDIPETLIREVIHEAVILDETVPYKPQEIYRRTSKK